MKSPIQITRHSQVGAIFDTANMAIVVLPISTVPAAASFSAQVASLSGTTSVRHKLNLPIDIYAACVYFSAGNSNSGVWSLDPRPAGFVFLQ
jgi:hypothetical protein